MKYFITLSALLMVLQIFTSCDNNATVSSENISDTATTKKDTKGRRIEILNPEALKVFDSSAVIEIIEKGFKWTEGPLYIADGDYLFYFQIFPIIKFINGRKVEKQALILRL